MPAASDFTRPTPNSIYRYYDALGVLIYVGITEQGMGRNQQHNKDKSWWPLVDRQEVEHCESRDQALAREKDLIRQFTPPFNVHHNPGHEAIRVAYQAMRESVDLTQQPLDMLRARKNLLPLRCLSRVGTMAQFVTRVEDAPLVRTLKPSTGGAVVSMDDFQVGHIEKVEVVGPCAKIQARVRLRIDFERAEARIKDTCQKGPLVCAVRYIRLSG